MSWKDTLRAITPAYLLSWNRKRKKNKRNKTLQKLAETGQSLTAQTILNDLKRMGIRAGDTLLVHSSLSRIGHLSEGPKTFIDALLSAIGPNGNLLMPTSPNADYQLNYIRNTPFFDVLNSPSKTGKITEYFRALPDSKRSLHPTEPVSAIGPLGDYFIKDHFNQLTPYNKNSPFYKVGEMGGKILYVGVTLDNAGTSLHTLEDAIPDFKYPVYYPEIMEIQVFDELGNAHLVKTKVHDPKYSKLRKCDQLIPHFVAAGVLKQVKIGQANTLLVDAKGFFDTMVKLYNEKGITMYTPNGETLNV
ncbi:hypothetical protein DNU06_08225 [Putridiphycobacter roseus]|uniref:Aminoglycoside N(3)-acetyltransferase n=1 Tax=Putridiphycobacter roseus TaxID=2219161 RepID=A0A2W1N129_9FLAO|nr:AAC(3) family N-acetyltransferase [Putridiphycobacter roseus]PZE17250.1 hypothetical protein DNU06_08225 [Putridiphycobacter roseus]